MIFVNYLLMCLVFGTTFLAIKVGIDAGAPPFFSAGLRFLLAGSILFAFMVIKRKATFSLLLRKEMFLTGMALTFGTFATLYWAEQHLSSGIAAILSATAPLMVLLLQSALARQRLSVHALAKLPHRVGGRRVAAAARPDGQLQQTVGDRMYLGFGGPSVLLG